MVISLPQIEKIKKMLAIEESNCNTCTNRSTDDDGSDYGFINSWDICCKYENYQYLKSFPFKKNMKCWFPTFWASRFPDLIITGTEREENLAYRMFWETIETAIMITECETRHMWE